MEKEYIKSLHLTSALSSVIYCHSSTNETTANLLYRPIQRYRKIVSSWDISLLDYLQDAIHRHISKEERLFITLPDSFNEWRKTMNLSNCNTYWLMCIPPNHTIPYRQRFAFPNKEIYWNMVLLNCHPNRYDGMPIVEGTLYDMCVGSMCSVRVSIESFTFVKNEGPHDIWYLVLEDEIPLFIPNKSSLIPFIQNEKNQTIRHLSNLCKCHSSQKMNLLMTLTSLNPYRFKQSSHTPFIYTELYEKLESASPKDSDLLCSTHNCIHYNVPLNPSHSLFNYLYSLVQKQWSFPIYQKYTNLLEMNYIQLSTGGLFIGVNDSKVHYFRLILNVSKYTCQLITSKHCFNVPSHTTYCIEQAFENFLIYNDSQKLITLVLLTYN